MQLQMRLHVMPESPATPTPTAVLFPRKNTILVVTTDPITRRRRVVAMMRMNDCFRCLVVMRWLAILIACAA
jgi:hypothetical protein